MKAMEGRRRTMWLEGYLRSSSRSRYLLFVSLPSSVLYSFLLIVGWRCGVVLFPECDGLQRKSVSLGRQRGKRENYIISKPIILQRIDILLGHCIPSAPSHYSTSPKGWNTYAVRRNLHPTISFSSSQTPIQPREYSQLRYASSGASFILLVSHFPSVSPCPFSEPLPDSKKDLPSPQNVY
jgi:hypothetical protein